MSLFDWTLKLALWKVSLFSGSICQKQLAASDQHHSYLWQQIIVEANNRPSKHSRENLGNEMSISTLKGSTTYLGVQEASCMCNTECTPRVCVC